jgi:hypothetical protein
MATLVRNTINCWLFIPIYLIMLYKITLCIPPPGTLAGRTVLVPRQRGDLTDEQERVFRSTVFIVLLIPHGFPLLSIGKCTSLSASSRACLNVYGDTECRNTGVNLPCQAPPMSRDVIMDRIPHEYQGSRDTIFEALKILASTAQSARDPSTRKHAIYLLGMVTDPRCVQTLTHALKDPEKAVRAQAMQALSLQGTAVSGELINLLRDPDWKVRYRSAEAIGIGKVHPAVYALTEALSDEKDHVRYMAAKSLGLLKNPVAIDPLRKNLDDENPYVRKMAALAIEECLDQSKTGR